MLAVRKRTIVVEVFSLARQGERYRWLVQAAGACLLGPHQPAVAAHGAPCQRRRPGSEQRQHSA